jgi:N-acetylmuramoyl-L-alanine amidase
MALASILTVAVSANAAEQTAEDTATAPAATVGPLKEAGALTMDAALAELGAKLRWDPLARTGALEFGSHRLVFRSLAQATEGIAVLDGGEVIRAPAPYFSAEALVFPRAFVNAVRAVVARSAEREHSRFRIAAILVDPGHGGKDTGAVGTHTIEGRTVKIVEKDIALQVATDFHAKLTSAYPDKRVLLTRKGDTYPTLEQRVAVANSVPLAENEAILFISIHANASFNKKARGYEVWYLSPEYRRTVLDADRYTDSTEVLPILNAMMEEEFTTESIIIARSIMSRLDAAIGSYGPSRGIKAEEWFVVRNARMPSVLVELGFVTNPEDAKLLSDPSYLRKLSDALYSGTMDFVTAFEGSGGFTAIR